MFKHCRKILFADFFCQLNKNCHLFFFCPIAVACGWNWGRKEGSAKNDPDLKMHWCRCRYRSQFKTTTTTKVGEAHETYNNLTINRGRPASRASDFVWEVSFHAEPWLDVIFWPRDQQRQQWNLKWLKWWERKCGCVIDKPGVTERSKCGGKKGRIILQIENATRLFCQTTKVDVLPLQYSQHWWENGSPCIEWHCMTFWWGKCAVWSGLGANCSITRGVSK